MEVMFSISDTPRNPKFPFEVWTVDDGGVRIGPKYCTYENMILLLLKSSTSISNYPVEAYLLPKGTLLHQTSNAKDKHKLAFTIDKQEWAIQYESRGVIKRFVIGFPKLISFVSVTGIQGCYKLDHMKLFAVNDSDKIHMDTQLYQFPYPNVRKDNGEICFGGNEKPVVKCLSELARAFNLFVAAPFGEDYGCRTSHGIHQFSTLLHEVEDKPFNDDWLVPTDRKLDEVFSTML